MFVNVVGERFSTSRTFRRSSWRQTRPQIMLGWYDPERHVSRTSGHQKDGHRSMGRSTLRFRPPLRSLSVAPLRMVPTLASLLSRMRCPGTVGSLHCVETRVAPLCACMFVVEEGQTAITMSTTASREHPDAVEQLGPRKIRDGAWHVPNTYPHALTQVPHDPACRAPLTLRPPDSQVGSFACGLFLVGCECEESGYVGSRPFRVNAGPVRAWLC